MLKTDENPPMLFPEHESISIASGAWWVAHTRSRFEKAFAWDMHHLGIGYFLPLVDRVKVSGGRKRRFVLPLFPSYVFFAGDAETCSQAIKTNRLCQIIPVVDQKGLIRELESIEKALGAKAELDLYPQAAVGQRCRVIGGSLKGLEGVVIQRSKRSRVVLQVSMLGQGAVMELDADMLELCE
jgi:transcription antitermination factor NusG